VAEAEVGDKRYISEKIARMMSVVGLMADGRVVGVVIASRVVVVSRKERAN
jgi:hypothetical protein